MTNPQLTFEVGRRCNAAGIEFTLGDLPTIHFPRGRGSDPVEINSEEHAAWILGEPFEDYRLLEGYEATWSPVHQVIECTIVRGGIESPLDKNYEEKGVRRTLKELGMDLDENTPLDPGQRIHISTQGDTSVSVGLRTNIQAILVGVIPPADFTQYLTLRITGARAHTHGEAVELLERVGNAVLFQVDLSRNLFLRLEREGESPAWLLRILKKHPEVAPLPPVRFEYDSGALSLYWHARSASGLPLLQFLGYYQVLEFYFYRYLRRKAEREILAVLEEPPFDQLRDADRSRLLEVIRLRYEGSKIGVGERELLSTTIKECVTLYDLRSFILDNDSRYEFYTSTTLPKKLSTEGIPILDTSPDHRDSVAERIYSIRCRIVHQKAGKQGPLLPSDPVVARLRHDIDLVRFLALKAIEKARRPL